MIVLSVTPPSFAQQWRHAREETFHAPVVAGELALPAGAVPGPFVDIEDVGDVATAVPIKPGRPNGSTSSPDPRAPLPRPSG